MRSSLSVFVSSLAVVAALTSSTVGCGRHLYGREQLTEDLAKHHIDLRWGRLGNAAQRVLPELRGPFIQVWSQRLQSLELQDMDVVDVAQLDEDTVMVVVNVTYVDKLSMSVATVQFPETWKRTDTGWLLSTVAELPATAGPAS